MRGVVTEMSSV